jgi:hypothetical protein
MRRASRSAQALNHGPKILAFLKESNARRLLVTAAESGSPPVTAISKKLLGLISAKEAKTIVVRQFIGLCVRAVLEEEGFEVAEKGVRVSRDPIFRTGSTYRRVQTGHAHSTLLARFIHSLTDEEVSQALMLLRKRQG